MFEQLDNENFDLLYEGIAEELGKKHELVNLAVLNMSEKDVEKNEGVVFSHKECNGITFAKAVIRFREYNCFLLECPCSVQIHPEIYIQVSSVLDASIIYDVLNFVLTEFNVGLDDLSWVDLAVLPASCNAFVCR
jgi:hypothetical protein